MNNEEEDFDEERDDDDLVQKVLTIKIEIDEKKEKIDLLEMLAIYDEDLSEQITKLPGQVAFIGALVAASARRIQELKDSFEAWYAREDEIQRTLINTKITETQIVSAIRRLPGFTERKKAASRAKFEYDILSKALFALDTKANMCQTHASNLRAELYPELSIKVREREDKLEQDREDIMARKKKKKDKKKKKKGKKGKKKKSRDDDDD